MVRLGDEAFLCCEVNKQDLVFLMRELETKKPNLENEDLDGSFIACAELVLPWLTSQELGSVSLTCRTLNRIANSVTLRRSLDASRAFENLPIPFCSSVDQKPYAYFLYTPSQIILSSEKPTRQPWGSALVSSVPSRKSRSVWPMFDYGSSGNGTAYPIALDSTTEIAPRNTLSSDLSSQIGHDLELGPPGPTEDYSSRGFVVSSGFSDDVGSHSVERTRPNTGSVGPHGSGDVRASLMDELPEIVLGCWCDKCGEGDDNDDSDSSCCPCYALRGPEIVSECGPGCDCGSSCANRLTQRGLSVRLKIVRDERKGWALYSDQWINQGEFICEYAGELLTTQEARSRQQVYDKLSSHPGGFSSALLVVREHLPSGSGCLRINIDATRIGNVARFINHSCDGGNLSTVLVRGQGAVFPCLCFFASRDIQPDKELTFSYGDARIRPNGSKQCFCGSPCCLGTLPSEET